MGFAIDIEQLRARAANAASPARAASQERPTQHSISDPYAGFQHHYETLLGCGLSESAAFDIAEALCLERAQDGERRVCALECKHHRRGCCMRSKSAGVPPQLGELAFIPQRCPAY